MILEVAALDVKPGQEADFERAMAQARPLIAASRGFRGMSVRRCLERPNRYLLQVEWETLEDHTVGFRRSDLFAEWRLQIGHHFESAPNVEHFAQ